MPAGTIFKRFDTTKLFVMTCQDVVERFHLCLSLLFVVAEEMDNSSRWWPNASLVWRCAQIFGAEICIDVIKHAVLGKFNEIRPGVYREFTRVSLCKTRQAADAAHPALTLHTATVLQPGEGWWLGARGGPLRVFLFV